MYYPFPNVPYVLSPYDRVRPIGRDYLRYAPYEISLVNRINKYVLRALAYIQSILQFLRSCSPFFERYGKVISEIPKLYHLFRAINELNNVQLSDKEDNVKTYPNELVAQPKPRLFI